MQKPQSKLILNPTILIFKEKTDSCSIWQSQLLSAPQKAKSKYNFKIKRYSKTDIHSKASEELCDTTK